MSQPERSESDAVSRLRDLLSRLTPHPGKAQAYLGDTYVQESVTQLESHQIDPEGFARGCSLLLLKPDAIVARAVDPTLDWLAEHGVRVVDAARVPGDRHLARALWYYSWNIASPQRRRLADLLVGICDSLVLVVSGTDAPLPFPVWLTEAKGPTAPGQRQPEQLRYLLGRYSYLLNMVHSPDDPADVLRELAIVFDEARRGEVIDRVSTGADEAPRARKLAAELYAQVPQRDFDRGTAVQELLREAASDQEEPLTVDPQSDADCAQLLAETWDSLADPWPKIVLGSYVLPMRVGTHAPTIPPVTAADWREGQR